MSIVGWSFHRDKKVDRPKWRVSMAAASMVVVLALALAAVLVLPAAPAAADVVNGTASDPTVSADPLPTVQIDGVVWTQAAAGNTVYVGGSFSSARPAGAAPGVNTTPRGNLLAYNLKTGNLVTSWAPSTNADVMGISVSPDGSRVYVVGTFTSISGVARYRIAAFDTSTGTMISSFAPAANGEVDGVVATNSTVYLAGSFTSMNGQARTKVAAVSASNGALLPLSADIEGGYGARAVVVSPDGSKIVIAGSFTSTNGSTAPGRGLAALNTSTGESMPWAVDAVARNAGTRAAMYSLYSDGTDVFGTAYDAGGTTSQDGFEGTFKASWSDGTISWIEDCHGDTYSVAEFQKVVYVSGHIHYCGNIGGFPQPQVWVFHHSLGFSMDATGTIAPDSVGYRSFAGNPRPSLEHWFPTWMTGTYTGLQQAAWSVTSAGDYLLYGGEFLGVDGAHQQGLVRFTTRTNAPNKRGPEVQGGAWTLNAFSYSPNEARLSWQANYDPDDATLTYQVFRKDLGPTPLATTTEASNFWTTPAMSYVDTSAKTGNTYDYRVVATDPWGNSTTTDWTAVTVQANADFSTYNQTVLNDKPVHYWPLGDSSSSSAADWASGGDLKLHSAAPGAGGPNEDQTSHAISFSGSSNSYASTASVEDGAQTFTLSAWFNSTSSAGGKIVGFGSSSTGNSSSYDRHIYLDSSGHVTFGVYNSAAYTVSTSGTYDDGDWHFVVATLGPDGETLYVDGKRVATRPDATTAQNYNGYWRIGGDSIGSWPGASSGYLKGSISDVAVYPAELTRDQVNAQWMASGRSSAIIPAPSDAYGQAVYSLSPTLYWRLDESSGTVAHDAGPDDVTGTYWGKVSQGAAGSLPAVPGGTAASFQPTARNGGGIASSTSFTDPTTYALEAWFKTTTTDGGKLIGFGNNATKLSTNYDRHLYMSPDGQLNFGVYTGSENVITSRDSYNDGSWHYVVAQQSSSGMQLYVDGSLAASGDQTAAQNYTGYWRLGGDSGWGGATYFTGTIDEFAVYPAALDLSRVLDHYQIGTVGKANQPPVASFTSSVDNLSVAVDASGSSDPDGTIASYTWDFGDSSTPDSGETAAHTYTAAGTYTVSLTVKDNQGAPAVKTAKVAVLGPNTPPAAAFTSTIEDLSAAFDGSGSQDSDGNVASYAWDFGDNSADTGVNASHTYLATGDYPVTLTVTDDRGGTDSVTHTITVTAPKTGPVIAHDDFARTVTSGWGSAPTGGTWSLHGGQASFAVADGTGVITLHPADTRGAVLSSVQTSDATASATFSISAPGTGRYVSLVGRRIGSSQYQARVLWGAAGSVRLYLLRDETALAASYLPGITVAAGDQLNVALDVSGSNPTSLSAKVWKVGDPEPDWQITGTDSTAALQTSGSVGVFASMSGSAPDSSVAVDVTYFDVTGPLATEPAGNQTPTAAFTSSAADLKVSFDGSGSKDSDGTIASYAWDFGDDSVGSAAKPTHTYSGAGIYKVTLTVKDDGGASDSVTHSITVTAPSDPGADQLAKDTFDRDVSSGWGTANDGGTWTVSGGSSAFNVSDGEGTITVKPTETRTATLKSLSSTDAVTTLDVSIDRAPAGGAQNITIGGRMVGSSLYSARIHLETNGQIRLYLLHDETAIGDSYVLPGGTYIAGQVLHAVVFVKGTNPTTLAVKVWRDGDTEPSDWQLTATDDAPAMQAAGSLFIVSALSGASTAGPTTIAIRNYLVTTS